MGDVKDRWTASDGHFLLGVIRRVERDLERIKSEKKKKEGRGEKREQYTKKRIKKKETNLRFYKPFLMCLVPW